MRPVLLLLVLGAFLLIVGITASGQAMLVTADASTTLIGTTVNSDAATVRSFVGLDLQPSDLQPGGLTPDRRDLLGRGLDLLVAPGGILHAALVAPDGVVLAADRAADVGRSVPSTAGLQVALTGRQAQAGITPPDQAGSLDALATSAVLHEYLPIVDPTQGRPYAVVAVWRDAAPLLARLDESRLHVVLITLTAALISALLLFLIFGAAQRRLTLQTVELLEATRRDHLTGTPNHGALVEALARTIADQADKGPVGVALVDLDDFGLLNDTHGHEAGDRALLEVASCLREAVPEGVQWGRYGPDEFLLIAPREQITGLEPALQAARGALLDRSLQFEASERLPVTISAGICTYPVDGSSVTTLLSVAAQTLDEARSGGGDRIRSAEARQPGSAYTRSYDVLKGLVIAVDTKDRYTRRHSEDVARYADFLARRLGLELDVRRALYTAATLHDVGKIGIPDAILRKPGTLTPTEYEIVKHHVALGDLIVRDLPDLDLIRDGIRNHHERWDGKGYLQGLAGEAIPLVGRIMAVGDAFSAMTTTRPYRKALEVEEALRRLEDAADSQLDPTLVQAFVSGLRTAADAPLPGQPPAPPAPELVLGRRAEPVVADGHATADGRPIADVRVA